MDKLLCIVGTNASGKSSLGIELALLYDASIVSADSRQVYEGLDLGSGKVTPDEMKQVPHYLIDVVKPDTFFSLSHYQKKAYEAVDKITGSGHKAFLVGGTGLYVNAVVDGYNLSDTAPDMKIRSYVESVSIDELYDIIKKNAPNLFDGLDIKNRRRVERAAEKALAGDHKKNPNDPRYDTFLIGVTWPREELYERIRVRLDKRLEEGMIEEVVALRENGVSDEFLYKLGLEYRYILMYLRNEFPDRKAFYDKLFMEIRHLAKEQMTWFRKRDDITWIDMKNDPVGHCRELIDKFYGIKR